MKKALNVLFAVIAIALATSCSNLKNIEYVHDTVYNSSVNVEYKYVHDSTYIDKYHYIYINGDTVYKVDSIVHNVYLVKKDTVRSTDTVYKSKDVIVNKTQYVNKYPLWPYCVFIITVVLIYLFIKFKPLCGRIFKTLSLRL